MRTRIGAAVLGAVMLLASPVGAQEGVRLGITYTPGVRPGLLMLGGHRGAVIDSIRTILERDLEFSDEFEMITLPGGDSLTLSIRRPVWDSTSLAGSEPFQPFVNYPLYAALGADYVVDVHTRFDSTYVASLYDVRGELLQQEFSVLYNEIAHPEFRLEVHRAADRLVQAVSGVMGTAASRIVFIDRQKIHRIDVDGADVVRVSPPGEVEAMSPTWAPDGRRMVYMEFPGTLYEHTVLTGERAIIPPTTEFQNFAPAYSPDGGILAFSRATGEGTDIYTYNLVDQCCLQRLTVGRLYDNLSPTFSPDGRRIAFVSNRPSFTQIYVMSADGTGQELFAPFEYGVSGPSNAPEWSPDGLHIAFHREVERQPQIFVMDVATQTVRQLTSRGRNYDPTWGPDGRHLAFVSERTGSRQVWIIDSQTGRTRQLTRLGEARLPSWSPWIAEQNN